jgi:hypothetical protein
MAVHGPEELKREGRLVSRNTRASLMSDTKWRKLFTALDASGLRFNHCIWKFVGRDDAVPGSMGDGLHPPWPWIDTSTFGPTPLRSIEWLWIPRLIKWGRKTQDVDRAAQVISDLGRYPIEVSERGLLIRGYLGKTPSEAEVDLAEALPLEA